MSVSVYVHGGGDFALCGVTDPEHKITHESKGVILDKIVSEIKVAYIGTQA